MKSCEADQEYWESHAKDDMKNIDKHRGRYRVRVTVEFNRFERSFGTYEEAREWRDRMKLLSDDLTLEKSAI